MAPIITSSVPGEGGRERPSPEVSQGAQNQIQPSVSLARGLFLRFVQSFYFIFLKSVPLSFLLVSRLTFSLAAFLSMSI